MAKAVIFDMDGLLIDSEPFWREAHIAVIGEKGYALTHDDVRHMAGKGTSHVVEEWRQRFGWQASDNDAIENQIVDRVLEEVKRDGTALPGVMELVELLHEHQVPMAVASSSAPELIDAVMERLGIRNYMVAFCSAKDEKRSKPFPDVFLSAAKALGVEPQDCLVFEDSLNGVRAAKAAGMKCIAVPGYPHDPAQFRAVGVDLTVPSLERVDWKVLQSL